jgi:hypothetical protein
MTDAPNQLLAGLDELPRYENDLTLFPRWLAFLGTLKPLRALATFAVQYWYYGQIYALGHQGEADDNLTVLAATKQIMAREKILTAK